MKKASIDIGSNTTLLLIAEVQYGSIISEENFHRVTQLGRSLQKTGVFHLESMDLTHKALQEYCELCRLRGIDAKDITVTATEASRLAKNAKEFFEKIHKDLDLNIQIISGEQEAIYTAIGVCIDWHLHDFVIMDIGGASTELILGSTGPFKIEHSISMPIGAVKVKEWMDEGIHEVEVEKILSSYDLNPYKSDSIIAVAGTMTSLSTIVQNLEDYDEIKVHNSLLTAQTLQKLTEKLMYSHSDKILAEYPFLGKRSLTIAAGSFIANSIAKKLDIEKYIISTRGLRHGSLLGKV
ncbi:MAG: hypothetical protein H6622_02175 [Halobacteriovoraceae bacterium]|nr:hypothetical protein [Halobacteriovoraceae bacterium]